MVEESTLGNARLMELNQPSLTKRGLRDGFTIGYKAAHGKKICSERSLHLAGRSITGEGLRLNQLNSDEI